MYQPALPATGSTMMAATLLGSCSGRMRVSSSTSGSSLPHGLLVVDVRVVHRVVDEAHVVDARQQRGAEHLAVGRDAAHAHAAEAHAVVARSRPMKMLRCPSPRARW
jgi:hypothetical protein